MNKFLKSHGTKVLGFVQVTFGALAGFDFWSPIALKAFLVANGVLVAWRGFFNSAQAKQ